MRRVSIFLLLVFGAGLTLPAISDPHYVQAMHPYWGMDEMFQKRLEKFDEPVDFDIESHENMEGETVYLYEYSVDIATASALALDIACPGDKPFKTSGLNDGEMVTGIAVIEMVGADPVLKNPQPRIENGRITWPLTKQAGRQAMWFYSWRAPVDRAYTVTTDEGEKKGVMKGPGCKE